MRLTAQKAPASWRGQSTPRVSDRFYKGLWNALLFSIPLWVLIGLAIWSFIADSALAHMVRSIILYVASALCLLVSFALIRHKKISTTQLKWATFWACLSILIGAYNMQVTLQEAAWKLMGQ